MSPEARTVTIMAICVSLTLLISYELYRGVGSTREYLKQVAANNQMAANLTQLELMNNAIRSDIQTLAAGGEAVEDLKDHTYTMMVNYKEAIYLAREIDPALAANLKSYEPAMKSYLQSTLALMDDSRAEVDLAAIMPAAGEDTPPAETSQAAFFKRYSSMDKTIQSFRTANRQIKMNLSRTANGTISAFSFYIMAFLALLVSFGLGMCGWGFLRQPARS